MRLGTIVPTVSPRRRPDRVQALWICSYPCRTGEIVDFADDVALTAKPGGEIGFDRDEDRLRSLKRATNKRQPPVPIPGRLLAHMRRWTRRGVVRSHFVEWNGQPVKSVKTGFATAVRLSGLSLKEGKISPHTLRHTAATWLMQRRADP